MNSQIPNELTPTPCGDHETQQLYDDPEELREFEKQALEWENRVSMVMDRKVLMHEWPDHFHSDLVSLWVLAQEFRKIFRSTVLALNFSFEFSLSYETFKRQQRIAELLSVYCDRRTSIDPSPILYLSIVRSGFSEQGVPVPRVSELSENVKESYRQAATWADVAITRINIWISSEVGNAKTKPSLDDRLLQFVALDRERALKMSAQELATAVGQKSKTRVLQTEVWKTLQAMRYTEKEKYREVK